MKQTLIALTTMAVLATSAPTAMAQVTTSQSYGPNGYSASRTIHRGNMTVTRSMSRGTFGLHGCNTVTRSIRTPFGIRKSSVRRCH